MLYNYLKKTYFILQNKINNFDKAFKFYLKNFHFFLYFFLYNIFFYYFIYIIIIFFLLIIFTFIFFLYYFHYYFIVHLFIPKFSTYEVCSPHFESDWTDYDKVNAENKDPNFLTTQYILYFNKTQVDLFFLNKLEAYRQNNQRFYSEIPILKLQTYIINVYKIHQKNLSTLEFEHQTLLGIFNKWNTSFDRKEWNDRIMQTLSVLYEEYASIGILKKKVDDLRFKNLLNWQKNNLYFLRLQHNDYFLFKLYFDSLNYYLRNYELLFFESNFKKHNFNGCKYTYHSKNYKFFSKSMDFYTRDCLSWLIASKPDITYKLIYFFNHGSGLHLRRISNLFLSYSFFLNYISFFDITGFDFFGNKFPTISYNPSNSNYQNGFLLELSAGSMSVFLNSTKPDFELNTKKKNKTKHSEYRR